MGNVKHDLLLLSDPVFAEQKKYWLDRLAGELPETGWMPDYNRVKQAEEKEFTFSIPEHVWADVARMSKKMDLSIYLILVTCLQSMLYVSTRSDDLCIVSPIYKPNRTHRTLNTFVLLQNRINGEMTFKELLLQTRAVAMEAYANQDFPLTTVLESLQPTRLGVACLLSSIHEDNLIDQIPGEVKFCFHHSDEKLHGRVIYQAQFYSAETVERLTRQFVTTLQQVVTNPGIQLAEVTILSEAEKWQILNVFNDTKIDYPENMTIPQLFAEQLKDEPDRVAVRFGTQEITYGQLDQCANQLAHRLQEKGVKPDAIVGICGVRSIELITGILAILKAGGAYLPIDPRYPKERINYMLEDSKCQLLLVTGELTIDADFTGEILQITGTETANPIAQVLENTSTSSNLAYIMYTSGSTGKPKGVMVEHKNVVRLVKNTNYVTFTRGERILQTGALVFDASTFEIWGALLNGLELVLVEDEIILDPDKLANALKEYHITTLWLTAPLFNQISVQKPDIFQSLKYLLVGGDVLSPKHINAVRMNCPDLTLINGYGPTENTTFSTCFVIDSDYADNIPIGKPIANSTAYILDSKQNLCPIGVPGELCVGGDGLARGYVNNPALTADKFVQNPFISGTRMYKTGDLARWLPDGNIEFIGRIDRQVKIRGFRIEPGEIENQLLRHAAVQEAVIVVKEDDQQSRYLCAYVVLEGDTTIANLREYLTQELPEYMMPSYFVQLQSIPLTANGKVDRNRLPEPDSSIGAGTAWIAPTNQLEEKLMSIWQEVLGIAEIGIEHNFFHIGGHSLKANLLISKIHQELNVEIPLGKVFKHPTIKELAAYINSVEESNYSAIQLIEKREYYPTSAAQKRLYILAQFDGINSSYNIPGAIVLTGIFDRARFTRAWKELIARHETLRTSFAMIDGEVVQKVHAEVELEISYQESREERVRQIITNFIRPFDLKKAPLFRIELVKIADDKHVVLFDMHHIISDGTSMGIIVREFISLYDQQSLPPLAIQYKDFCAWQNELFNAGIIDRQEKYWLETFAGAIPVLNLPTDFPRPAVQSYAGNSIFFEVSAELTARLIARSKESNATLFMTLLAAFNVLLSKYSGQEDIVVGTPVAGRRHADLQGIIGMFVNTLALRNYPAKNKTFREFLQEVKENALQAYENQDYQFEQLVEKLDIPRDLSRNPLFDTMFSLQNAENTAVEISGLHVSPYEFDNSVAKFDLTLNAQEVGNKLTFSLAYCVKLFKKETLERLVEHYQNILHEFADNPAIRLNELSLLSADERAKILTEFNHTQSDYPADQTIQQLFEKQVQKTPHGVALAFGGKELTYQELNRQANQLAHLLREQGITRNRIVGLMVKRSFNLIIGILGILKAGGAYLPIDPEYPTERVKYMLEDSGASLLVCDSEVNIGNSGENAGFAGDMVNLAQLPQSTDDSANPVNLNTSRDLAYVIYTSGSTGKPKGVLLEHRSVNNFIHGICALRDFGAGQTFLCLTTVSFDIFVLETLLPLCRGSKVVIASETAQVDPLELANLIVENQIDILQVTPSRLGMLLNYSNDTCLQNLQVIMVGGEPFPVHLLEKLQKRTQARIYNMYGPTETTVWSTVSDLTTAKKVVIGKPIANTRVYIIDAENRLQPIGVPGELCIAGDGLARGYHLRPELTGEKFVPDPFIAGEMMYRTGDLARWLPDGNLEFVGRIDQQIKIRGFRIEPGEIENQLRKYAAVTEALVLVREDANQTAHLCAYIVAERELTVKELRDHLAKELPDYMIPAYFVQLAAMPLTPNGKVDRKALPRPEGSIDLGVEYVAPTNPLEEKLVAIWQRVLGIEQIGINHNFFQMGGNSLNVLQTIHLIREELGVDISLNELFAKPTIATLACEVDRESSAPNFQCVVRLNKVTPGKRNIFMLHGNQGHIYQYKELAKVLEGEYNFYAIQPRGIVEGKIDSLAKSVEEMVADYLAEITTIQSEGPYIIGGYCYGTRVSYQLATTLEREGAVVERLVIFDEPAFISEQYARVLKYKMNKLVTLYDHVNKSTENIRTDTVGQYINDVIDWTTRPKNLLKAPLVVIKAKESTHLKFERTYWECSTSGQIEILETPDGDHVTIFQDPYVEGLADVVRKALED